MSFFDDAAPLARHGWPIHPVYSFSNGGCSCGRGDHGKDAAKHPILSAWVDAASTDLGQISLWDARWPDANVGVVTGPRSGLLVFDVDGENGRASLAELERIHGPLPVTPKVLTGSGDGHQYLFRWIPECEGLTILAGFLPGLDYRGKGGQVVAPPSRHRSGRTYEWIIGLDVPLAEPPSWLLAVMRSGHKPKMVTPNKITVAQHEPLGLIVVEPVDDLLCPGVEEGRRHQELLRRVGHHLARGDSAETVLDLAIRWAERCNPPYPIDDTEKHTLALIGKEQRKQKEQLEASERAIVIVGAKENLFARSHGIAVLASETPTPLPAVPHLDSTNTLLASSHADPEWPTLGENALHGLAGEMVRTLAPRTEADPVALLVTFLTAFGNCVGRKPYFAVEGDRHHANLFAVLVGQSAKGRKGTSKGRVLSLFNDGDPWLQHCLAGGLSSGEGLIFAVRDAITSIEPVREKGKVIGYEPFTKDHGVEDKRLMIFEPEFAKVLKTKGREGNTLSEVIRESWDSGNLKVLTKNSPICSTDAHVSILGHVTVDELVECLRTTDAYNGLANRFLWPLVKRSQRLPDGGGDLDLAPLRLKLEQALAKARTIERVTRTEDAAVLWREAYLGELAIEHPGLVGACTARSDAQVLRLSLVYALLDGSEQINSSQLQAALAVWRYCEESAKVIFRRAEENHGVQSSSPPPDCRESLALRLLNAIRAEPGVNRRGLFATTGNRAKAEEMDAALNWLLESGLAEHREKPGKGRPAECWWPTSERTIAMCDEPVIVSSSPSETETGDASERAKSEVGPPSLLDRSQGVPVTVPMQVKFEAVDEPGGSLAGLSDALTWIAANQRKLKLGDGGGVGCTPEPVPDWVSKVLAANQERLRSLVPPKPEDGDDSFLDDLRS